MDNTDFLELSREVINKVERVGKDLETVENVIDKNALLLLDNADKKLIENLNNSRESINNIATLMYKLFTIGQYAFNNINKDIKKVKNEIKEDIGEEISQLIDNNNENYDYLQEMIVSQNKQIKKLNETVENLFNMLKPPQITSDHFQAAKYLIENVKNSSDKSIKGSSITIQNVAAILEEYDRLKKYEEEYTKRSMEKQKSKRLKKTFEE